MAIFYVKSRLNATILQLVFENNRLYVLKKQLNNLGSGLPRLLAISGGSKIPLVPVPQNLPWQGAF
jgi:hypothetical protein